MSTLAAGNALLSVFDKAGIEDFAAGLAAMGWKIYASGGTARAIEASGTEVTDVADLVGGSAILGHRVVTLSREVHAGLLADMNKPADMQELRDLGIPAIDLLCVDMYPMEEVINKPGASKQDVIEMTDVGGPTLLRSAAKGRRIVLSVAEQRQPVLDWLAKGRPDDEVFREELAARAEYEVARYVAQSAFYWSGREASGFLARRDSPTKYGENPWQENAGLYADSRGRGDPLDLQNFTYVRGDEKSFINITDMDRLLQTATHIAAGFERNFGKVPFLAIGVKHGNACGAGVAETLPEAVERMLEGDTRAIFGGVVMVNGEIDKAVAETLLRYAMEGAASRLLDGVIGSAVTGDALKILKRKKLRIAVNPALENLSAGSLDTRRRIRPVRGGFLEQPNYTFVLDLSAEYLKRYGSVTKQQERDLVLAWAVGTTSNSNTITIAKNGQLLGNGVGQQDRVGAAQLALVRTTIDMPDLADKDGKLVISIKLDPKKLHGSVAFSDSFFPFPDGPELLARAGVRTILTTSGSVADERVVEALKRHGASILMIPDAVGRGFYAH